MAKEKTSAKNTGERLKRGPWRKILIPHAANPRAPYSDPNVKVAINGYIFSIRRGTPVVVPKQVADLLANRTRITMIMKRDESDGFMRSTPVEVQDYPFQDLGPCSEDGSDTDGTPEPAKRTRTRAKLKVDASDPEGLPELATP